MEASQLKLGDVVESRCYGLQRVRALAWIDESIMVYYDGNDQRTERFTPEQDVRVIAHRGQRVYS